MKKIFLYTIILVSGLLFMTSCQKELEAGGTTAEMLSGDWIVTEYSLEKEALYGPYTITIYNTSFAPDSIWVNNIYDSGIIVKAKIDSESSFSLSSGVDVAGEHDGHIEIKEAFVINKDSIVFRVVLYDEDGEVADDYLEAGHRYTGW